MPPYNLQWNTAKGHFQKALSDSIILFLLIFVIIYVLNFMVRFNRIIFYSDMRLLTICLFVLLKEQATVTKKVIFQLEVYFCSLTGSLVFFFFHINIFKIVFLVSLVSQTTKLLETGNSFMLSTLCHWWRTKPSGRWSPSVWSERSQSLYISDAPME